jgi:hypothetical protein
LLRSSRDTDRRDAAMRQRKPFGQLMGGLGRARPIERHHRRWHARAPAQLGTPPVADGRDLDVVHAPANGFFKAMDGHVCNGLTRVRKTAMILRRRYNRSSERRREGDHPRRAGAWDAPELSREFFLLSDSPQLLHGPSTGFPQWHKLRRRWWELQLWNA